MAASFYELSVPTFLQTCAPLQVSSTALSGTAPRPAPTRMTS